MSCCAWITRQYCTLGHLRKPFMATRMLLNNFLVHGLACSMCYLYTSSERKFYYFCIQLDRVNPLGSPCPADEWDLCLFATFLANAVQYSTIKVYISAVHSLRIDQGFPNPFSITCDSNECSRDAVMAVILKALDVNTFASFGQPVT